MATIKNDELREAFNYLATINNIIEREVENIKRNKQYIDKIVPNEIIRIYSQREKSALMFAGTLTTITYENSVVSLVTTFERILFAKYRNTYGILKKVVSVNTTKPLDYYKSREKFINDKIDKLSGIIYLVEGHINSELKIKLNQIKEHRNYIAHGKRDAESPTTEYTLNEMVLILDNVIREIEN